MVKSNSEPEVVYDQHHRSSKKRTPHQMGFTEAGPSRSLDQLQLQNEEMDMDKLWKEIRRLGTSAMTWKERKKLENQQVVDLGGRPPQKQRRPLSVAKGMMKMKKKREQKQLEEALVLGQFMKKSRKKEVKRKPEDRVLRATEGHLKGGILNVKHLLKPNPPRSNEVPNGRDMYKGKRNGSKGRGNKKGKSRRH